jgi:hypothetical protein
LIRLDREPSLAAELRASGPVDRVVSIVVPPEAAGNEWRWQMLLVGRVARGVPREDRYPVRVVTEQGGAASVSPPSSPA